jgi:hypothetical protein
MSRIDDLVKKYTTTFGENFPIFSLRTAPASEVEALIERCLKEGHPYTPTYTKDAVH